MSASLVGSEMCIRDRSSRWDSGFAGERRDRVSERWLVEMSTQQAKDPNSFGQQGNDLDTGR
eukprot:14105768-Alexandrium_andersonii.AAC.1